MINNDKKITLAVIFGGVSSEHDISCISAKGIVSNIDYSKYNLILLGITKDGRWFIFNDNIDKSYLECITEATSTSIFTNAANVMKMMEAKKNRLYFTH